MKSVVIFLISWLWVSDVLSQYVVYARQARQDEPFFVPYNVVSESIYKNLNECYRFLYQDASKKRLLRVERLSRGELSDELSQINACKVSFKYDGNGRLVEKVQFNMQGKIQSVKRFRYKQGRRVEESLYDGANQLFSKTLFRYDKAGRLIETAFVDDKNRRQNTSLGYAIERINYDAKGNPILIAWYDHFGELSRETYKFYDDKGNAIELRHVFFPDTSNADVELFKYNDAGQWIERIETDAKKTSFRKTLRRYDTSGNLLEEASYNNLGNLVDNSVEIAKTIFEYRNGRKVRERAYNSRLVLRTDVQFDEFGQVVERAQYASDGTLLELKRNQYDSFGNLIEERFFKHNSQQREIPVETRRYEKGKLIERIRYDKDGKPL